MLAGTGQGLCYSAGLSNTLKHFPDKRGLVGGLVTGVNGGASILLAPLASSMARSDVGRMMTILGLAFLTVTTLAALALRPAPTVGAGVGEGLAANLEGGGVGPRSMLRAPAFWLIFGIFACGAFSGVMIAGNAGPIAVSMYGLSIGVAATFVSMYSAANMAGRLLFGSLSDRIGQTVPLLTVFALVAVSLAVLVIGRGTSVALGVGLVGLGLCYGGIMGVMPAVVMSTFGRAHQGVNYGLAFTAYSVAALFAPQMAASIGVANGGDFSQAFAIAIAAALAGLALVLLLRHVQRTSPISVTRTSRSSASKLDSADLQRPVTAGQ